MGEGAGVTWLLCVQRTLGPARLPVGPSEDRKDSHPVQMRKLRLRVLPQGLQTPGSSCLLTIQGVQAARDPLQCVPPVLVPTLSEPALGWQLCLGNMSPSQHPRGHGSGPGHHPRALAPAPALPLEPVHRMAKAAVPDGPGALCLSLCFSAVPAPGVEACALTPVRLPGRQAWPPGLTALSPPLSAW